MFPQSPVFWEERMPARRERESRAFESKETEGRKAGSGGAEFDRWEGGKGQKTRLSASLGSHPWLPLGKWLWTTKKMALKHV